ncbi:MAG: hypothetical protein ACOY3P_06250 [Planctomycetota bacterium]
MQWLPCVQLKNFRTIATGHWQAAELRIQGSPAARPGRPESIEKPGMKRHSANVGEVAQRAEGYR